MKITKPLQFQAYEKLKDMILSGHFEKQTIYSETRVAKEMGLSRTPLRDAIQRLEQERYLDVIPSKGFRLHELTSQDLLETYQIRCALEGFCVVQLAKDFQSTLTKEVIHSLDYYIAQQAEVIASSGSIESFAEYDDAFHKKIVYSLNNSVITETFDSCHYQMSQQTLLSLQAEGRMAETLEEHQNIVENIRIGAVGRSYKAALTHLEKPKGIIKLDTSPLTEKRQSI